MDIFRRMDPLILVGAAAALLLTASSDPWWTVRGADNNGLLTVQIFPFYFHVAATGLSTTATFADFLGPVTRGLLIIALVALGVSSLRPFAWWRELAVYFGLSALVELYLSFLLNYHAAETLLLGTYGMIPPYSGSGILPANVVGLDLNTYVHPLVTAGFSLPFYVGFLSLGLVGGSMILKHLRARNKQYGQKGLEAIFTPESD